MKKIHLVGLLLVAACSKEVLRLNSVKDLNRGLYYLPLSVCGGLQPPDPPENGLNLLPGMRLTFLSTPMKDFGKNDVVPTIASHEWIVPDGTFSREDYFLFSYLLSTAYLPQSAQAAKAGASEDLLELWRSSAKTADGGVDAVLAEKFLCPMISSLTIHVRKGASTASVQCGPEWVRSAFEGFGSSGLESSDSPQDLSFRVPMNDGGLEERRSEHWSEAYFQHPILPVGGTPGWLQSTAARGRGMVKVDVPIRFASEMSSVFVPAHWSLADVEERFGIRVKALRRSKDFLGHQVPAAGAALECGLRDRRHPCAAAMAASPDAGCAKMSGPDSYFTVWFGEAQDAFGAEAMFQFSEEGEESEKKLKAIKSKLLIGHSDVLYFERTAGSDNPGYRR